jgi:23S rRNA pseudouridine1911/1915/1917 synthase
MHHHFVLDSAQCRERVDKVLALLLPDVSRTAIQRWILAGSVRIDGRVCQRRDLVSAGAVIDVEIGPTPLSRAEPDPHVEFGVVFEDEHLIVVDKPAGLVVHPGRGHWVGTLVSGLLARPGFGRPPSDERDPEGHQRPGVVHRIDKDTSGLLVVAKDEKTREGLKRQFSERTLSRLYRAITLGIPKGRRFETHYGRHPNARLKFSSKLSSGKLAVTNLDILERLAGGRAAFVECRLETGRTHQIRVHLAEQGGAPIFADVLYGGSSKDPSLRPIAERLGRQALHAHTLGFVHPITAEKLDFISPLPSDMTTALEALRAL